MREEGRVVQGVNDHAQRFRLRATYSFVSAVHWLSALGIVPLSWFEYKYL